MKQLLIASTAALALAACAENEAQYADVDTIDDGAIALNASQLENRTTPSEFMLTSLLNADIMGSEGDEFTDVEDVFIRDGRITGISFDADAAFGGKRYAEFASLTLLDDDNLVDGTELDVMIPRTEDSFDDFDLIDENVQLTYGDAGEDMIGRDVSVVGYDDADIEDVVFSADGTLKAYMIDPGLASDPVRVMPSKVMLTTAALSTEPRTEVLGEVEYDDEDDYEDAGDYRPERK